MLLSTRSIATLQPRSKQSAKPFSDGCVTDRTVLHSRPFPEFSPRFPLFQGFPLLCTVYLPAHDVTPPWADLLTLTLTLTLNLVLFSCIPLQSCLLARHPSHFTRTLFLLLCFQQSLKP
ncbi:uncharacterized protein EI97DRAFT_51142 [Westerdykella ornata]|uniref:Uncharacterized protein n=1 Tax=Westerdykella ornata TaxID=318751 RepID=A0A6A6JIW4_WESOR|nr:uncharacterized protein EI97DRAFT_51142 [Westerdykella ornata]KAF2276175.1 hypothetical protein EI97DRAFT_51142 [Westerdykella ornata]